MDTTKSVTKRAASYSLGSLISRFSGLLREVVTAACFGSNASVGAFFVAYRFSHILRRLLGEGGLIYGFVPYFEGCRKESEAKARHFFRDLFGTLAFLLLLLIISLELGLMGSTFFVSQSSLEVVRLCMVMLPGLFFIALWALFGALHQCEGKYFLPGISPTLFNGIWIATALVAARYPVKQGVFVLGVGTVVAYATQMVSLLPLARSWLSRAGRPQLFSPEVKRLMQAVSFTVIGVAATQVNSFVDMVFARVASLEGPAILAYAIRLEQFPLALVPIALSAALLPTLSRMADPKKEVATGLNRVFLLLLPCTVAIVTMGKVLINAIYGHGQFDVSSVAMTSRALCGYGVGLIPTGFTIVLSQSYFARKEFKVPMMASIQSVIFNMVLNSLAIFYFKMGPESVAWATSIASLYNMVYLMKGHTVEKKGMIWALFLGLVSGAIVYFSVQANASAGITRNVFEQIQQLLLFGAPFIVFYFFPLFLLHRKRRF